MRRLRPPSAPLRLPEFANVASLLVSNHVGRLIPLAFLAPDIAARILSGIQPVDLTTENLTKRIDLPPGWTEQRTLLGFD